MTAAILIKALALGLLLLFAQTQAFSWISIILFIGFATFFYLQPIFRTTSLFFSFASFIILALLVPSRFAIVFQHAGFASTPAAGLILFSAAFAFLFYLLIGIKNLLLIHRREWYYLLYLSLIYLALLLFFSIGSSVPFALKSIVFFFFLSGMLRELLRFLDFELTRLHKVAVFTLSLIFIECLWAVALLPIGFSNAASLMVVVIFAMSELLQRYLRGTLTARFIRLDFLLLVAFTGLIFLFSNWKL